jgi:hypothetical protein
MGHFSVPRVAHCKQLPQLRQRVNPLQQRSLRVMPQPSRQIFRTCTQVNHWRTAALQLLTIRFPQHNATTGGQHNIRLAHQVGQHMRLHIAEADLTVLLKPSANAAPQPMLNFRVCIHKPETY